MWWPWSRTAAFGREVEQRSVSVSIGDPAVAELLGLGTPNLAGVSVGESSVLGLSAVWRCVSLIAGSVASLPMRTIETNKNGYSQRARSFLDSPGGPGPDALTAYEWKETVAAHLLLHGNAFLLHILGGAGQIVGLLPIAPLAVSIEAQPDGRKLFKVSLNDGTQRVFDSSGLTHIPALGTDGIRGLSPISVARNTFGISIAGDRAAAKLFTNGALVSGLVTPEEDLTEDEAKTIKTSLRAKMAGVDNAADVAVINRKLKFQQWSLSMEDAQFLQSRAFQTQEIARWFGVPNHLLAVTENSTTFGTGLGELNRAYARYTLEPWTTRIQERLSRLLTGGKKVEFDYTAFVQPAPEVEIPLLIQQVDAGLLTLSEARKIRNLPPLTEDVEQYVNQHGDGTNAEIDSPAAQFGATL